MEHLTQFGDRYRNVTEARRAGTPKAFHAFDVERDQDVLFGAPYGRDDSHIIDACADALDRLDHRCILPLLDLGTSVLGFPFFTQPRRDAAWVPMILTNTTDVWTINPGRFRRVLTLRDLAGIIGEAAETVQHVHQSGFMHLQLRPWCLRLTVDGGELLLTNGFEAMPPIKMSPNIYAHFAAPEQLPSPECPIDARADVHALGAVLAHSHTT